MNAIHGGRARRRRPIHAWRWDRIALAISGAIGLGSIVYLAVVLGSW